MENQEHDIEQNKEAVKKDAQGLFLSVKTFLVELLDFRSDTDREATMENIKNDIPMKGATAWILICSIFVASIGLNADSTAVVIGAMLISPLMGPILGMGMSIAINDIDTLKRSLINLATMIVLSLLTAYLFFAFFPLGTQETSELLGRTKPDIRDVLIAFFGGLGLIIARTKKGTIASVIFGVAIATALMPPLCTAGYGLALGNWTYFLGAMNLFTINTIFIALATFIVLKVLRFPMLKYANSKKRKRIAQLASLAAIVVMVYPTMTFIKVLKESGLQNDYEAFVETEVRGNPELWLQRGVPKYDEKNITLYFNGEIAEATIADLKNEIKKYENIGEFQLDIFGNKSRSFDKISDAYDRAINELDEKNTIIYGLQKEVKDLQFVISEMNEKNKTFPFSTISKDAKIRFQDLNSFAYSKRLYSKDFSHVDTLDIIDVTWRSTVSDSIRSTRNTELKDWIKTQVVSDSLIVEERIESEKAFAKAVSDTTITNQN